MSSSIDWKPFLGKKIEKLNAERTFDHWLSVFGGLAAIIAGEVVYTAAENQTF